MGYIKKNSTLMMLFLLIVALGSYGITTIYYQRSMQRINIALNQRDAEFAALEDTYTSLSQNHSALAGEYDLKLKRETELSEQFTEIKDVKEGLEDEANTLSANLNLTKSKLNLALVNISRLSENVEFLNEEIISQEYQITNLTEQLHDCVKDAEKICEDASAVINITRCEDYS